MLKHSHSYIYIYIYICNSYQLYDREHFSDQTDSVTLQNQEGSLCEVLESGSYTTKLSASRIHAPNNYYYLYMFICCY